MVFAFNSRLMLCALCGAVELLQTFPSNLGELHSCGMCAFMPLPGRNTMAMWETVLAWHPLALFLCYAVLVPHGTCRLWCQGSVLELLTRAYVVCLARCELLVAGMMPQAVSFWLLV
jgi:hypothetical protein